MIFTIFDGKVVKKGSKSAVLYNFRPKSNNRPSKKTAAAITGCGVHVLAGFGTPGRLVPYFAASIILCFRVQSLSERST